MFASLTKDSSNHKDVSCNVVCVGISVPHLFDSATGIDSASADAMTIPLYAEHVAAGFPSPADSYIDEPLNLNSYLIEHPSATYFVRVSGESMTGAGIFPDDLLIVDRSLTAKNGDIVIAIVDGEFTVKRLAIANGRIELRPENPAFRVIRLGPESELEIWGVVRYAIKKV